jgi:hypothetical protein
VTAGLERFDDFISGYERMLSECCSKNKDGATANPPQRHARHEDGLTNAIHDFLPYTSKLLSDELTELVSAFNGRGRGGRGRLQEVHGFCGFVVELLNGARLSPKYSYFADVFDYESSEVALLVDEGGSRSPAFTGVNKLNGQGFKASTIAGLRPLRTNHCVFKSFDYDIQHLLDRLSAEENPPDTVQRRPTSLLFARLPNMKVLKLKINQTTRSLLELCDGTNTTEAIMRSLAGPRGQADSGGADGQLEVVTAALGRLYDRGVIIFC